MKSPCLDGWTVLRPVASKDRGCFEQPIFTVQSLLIWGNSYKLQWMEQIFEALVKDKIYKGHFLLRSTYSISRKPRCITQCKWQHHHKSSWPIMLRGLQGAKQQPYLQALEELTKTLDFRGVQRQWEKKTTLRGKRTSIPNILVFQKERGLSRVLSPLEQGCLTVMGLFKSLDVCPALLTEKRFCSQRLTPCWLGSQQCFYSGGGPSGKQNQTELVMEHSCQSLTSFILRTHHSQGYQHISREKLIMATFPKVCATNHSCQKHPQICLKTKSDFWPHPDQVHGNRAKNLYFISSQVILMHTEVWGPLDQGINLLPPTPSHPAFLPPLTLSLLSLSWIMKNVLQNTGKVLHLLQIHCNN